MSQDATETNIEKQLVEIEILKSIYPNLNEFQIEDEEALLEAQLFLSKQENSFKRNLGFIIKLNAEIDDLSQNKNNDDTDSYTQLPLEIVCRLPKNYPITSPPNVIVRCSKLNLNRKLTEELSNYIVSSHENECSILNIIEWIKSNVHRFLTTKHSRSETNSDKNQNKTKIFSRMWVYSHHIYSLNKRRSIIDWAKDLDLNGFSKPGKPGVICVEGEQSNVQAYLTKLKSVNWQRLMVKETESFEVDCTVTNKFSKFDNFEEKIFNTDSNSNIDLGLFFSFLKERGLENIFNLYFGVEGKESSSIKS